MCIDGAFEVIVEAEVTKGLNSSCGSAGTDGDEDTAVSSQFAYADCIVFGGDRAFDNRQIIRAVLKVA